MGVLIGSSLTSRPTETLRRARALRAELTDAERKLWYVLRRKSLGGARFRRQVPLGGYTIDFCCLKAKLIIEVDGGQHGERQPYDDARTRSLQARGFRVVRFWDNEVLNNLDGVVAAVSKVLAQSPHPNLPPQNSAGEGKDNR